MQKSKVKTQKLLALLLLLTLVPAGLVSAQLKQPNVVENCTVVGGIPIPSAFCGVCAGIICIGPGGPAAGGSVTEVIVSLINVLLFIVGLLAILFLIIGGYRYIVAHGNEEYAESAKKTITNAILGLVIVIMSFVMVRVIATALIYGKG